jgi:hypothetical protein
MFQFTRFPPLRVTEVRSVGFPHSDIPDSFVCTQLVEAFRSVPRPSSALDAKASPVCPSLLCLDLPCGEEMTLGSATPPDFIPMNGQAGALVRTLPCRTGNMFRCLLHLCTCQPAARSASRCASGGAWTPPRPSMTARHRRSPGCLPPVEIRGLEPLTYALQRRRSPN